MVVDKVFDWTDDFENMASTTNPQGMTSSSTLSLTLSSAEVFILTCAVTISIPGDPSVSASGTSNVTVTGKEVGKELAPCGQLSYLVFDM